MLLGAIITRATNDPLTTKSLGKFFYISGADVRGLTAAMERWSAAEPAAGGDFRTPSHVCEIVMLPSPTGESRNRFRGMHVLNTKP